jgi:predicted metal-binding membrane protein
MNTIEKIILIALILAAALSWFFSREQPDMMKAMMTYNPALISLFAASWTIGMAAMMFPAIIPMVLLYNRMIGGKNNNNAKRTSASSTSLVIERDSDLNSSDVNTGRKNKHKKKKLLLLSSSLPSLKISLFVSCYLLVWAATGIVLLLAWSIPTNTILLDFSTKQIHIVYGILLIISGVYQFSSLKTKCLGYCESPLSFFMRRWKNGTLGAVKMGIYHGLYCLGCCWPYFLIMVALGWMNLLWMGLFAGIIFAEKIWRRGGIWIARSTGAGLTIVGIMAILGLTTVVPNDMDMHNKRGVRMESSDGAMPMNMNMNMNMNMITKSLDDNNMQDNNVGFNKILIHHLLANDLS